MIQNSLHETHLKPSMNPDGFENSMIGSCSGVTGRSNMNDVDLNRDFPTWDDKGYGNMG